MTHKIETPAQFKAARLAQGLTQAQLAAIMRLPNPVMTGYETIGKWENGKSRIPGPALVVMEMIATGWRPKGWSK